MDTVSNPNPFGAIMSTNPQRPQQLLMFYNADLTLNWDLLCKELSKRTEASPKGLLFHIPSNVQIPKGTRIFGDSGSGILLAGSQALKKFMENIPYGFQVRQLDYGSNIPQLLIVDSPTVMKVFWIALFYPEPYCYDGRNLYYGASFLLENQPLRDRLFVHQIRRSFAPHEPSIFAVEGRTLSSPARGLCKSRLPEYANPSGDSVPISQGVSKVYLPY